MTQFSKVGETETASEKRALRCATACSPDSVSPTSSKPEKVRTPQSSHNFSDLTNLVKKKWYANETPSPSVSRSKPQLPLLVTIDEPSPPAAQLKSPPLAQSKFAYPAPPESPSPAKIDSPSPLQLQSPSPPQIKSPPSPPPKLRLPLLEPTNEIPPNIDVSPTPAETIQHGSPRLVVSSKGSPAYDPSWYWPIQPYEHWSLMPAVAEERADSESNSDENKIIPFPPYVEPCVPGFDFTTGKATEIEANGPSPPQPEYHPPPLDYHPPFTMRVSASTIQSTAPRMIHNSMPCVPDSHFGVHPRDAEYSFNNNTGPCLDFGRSPRDVEVEALKATISKLTRSVGQIVEERDAANRKAWQVSYNLADAQQAVYIQEEEIMEAKRVLIAEQLKTASLEEEMHDRQIKFEDKFGKLQKEHAKKVDECDMQREELREQEQLLHEAEERVLVASRTTEALNGAAHLVVPEKQTILPDDVVSCFECYANSRECDNFARCRSCKETQSKCARWRCGMQHVLGECSAAPCKLPHSGMGWLIVQHRPEW